MEHNKKEVRNNNCQNDIKFLNNNNNNNSNNNITNKLQEIFNTCNDHFSTLADTVFGNIKR
jgi:hemerythrin